MQFLITTGDNLDYLDGVHTVFGEVTEGMDIIKKINETFVDKDFVPYQDIRCGCYLSVLESFNTMMFVEMASIGLLFG